MECCRVQVLLAEQLQLLALASTYMRVLLMQNSSLQRTC
jgi:hypothetical protein